MKIKSNFKKGRAWIEIDLDKLRCNVVALQKLLPDTCELIPVIKADAYGHGAIEIAKELNQLDIINTICVGTVLEGVELRKNGVKKDILISGYTYPDQFYLIHEFRLIQTVVDYNYSNLLNSYGEKFRVHIKIDTGMHRLGERYENIDRILEIFHCKNLEIEGIFSHLCVSDSRCESDENFTHFQIDNFNKIIFNIKKYGIKIPKIHIQASYGLLNYPELQFDYTRIGIAIYGVLSDGTHLTKCDINLHPILSLKTRIAITKKIFKDEPIGYGLNFVASADMEIAVLTIGYADGVPRNLSCGIGNVLINGRKAPIIGNICMDQMTVDITNIPSVNPGDIAVIIGKSGNDEITVCQVAEQSQSISNEILSRLGRRIERVYLREEKVLSIGDGTTIGTE